MKEITENDFQHCFKQWRICIEHCRYKKDVCILKGIIWDMYKFKIKYFTALLSLFNSHTSYIL